MMHPNKVWMFSSLFVILGCIQLAQLKDQSHLETFTEGKTKNSQSAKNQKIQKMWTLELAEMKEIKIAHYKYFDSSNNYVVQTEEIIYYWVGENTPKEIIGEAAAYAVIVSVKTFFKVTVQREVQGQESPAFRALFKNGDADEYGFDIKTPVAEKIGVQIKADRMFLFGEKENDLITLKEVEISRHHVQSYANICIVFVVEKVFVFCRPRAPASHKRGAEALARIMMKRKGLISNNFEYIVRDDSPFFKTLKKDVTPEIAIQPNEFTPAEMRQIFDQTGITKDGAELFYMQVYKMSFEEDGTLRHKPLLNDVRREKFYLPDFLMAENGLMMSEIKDDECYLIDSGSNAGLLVWYGKYSNIYIRKISAKMAEIFLMMKSIHNYATPITFIYQNDEPVGVKSMRQLLERIVSDRERSISI